MSEMTGTRKQLEAISLLRKSNRNTITNNIGLPQHAPTHPVSVESLFFGRHVCFIPTNVIVVAFKWMRGWRIVGDKPNQQLSNKITLHLKRFRDPIYTRLNVYSDCQNCWRALISNNLRKQAPSTASRQKPKFEQ